jgi:hypothetical protein
MRPAGRTLAMSDLYQSSYYSYLIKVGSGEVRMLEGAVLGCLAF